MFKKLLVLAVINLACIIVLQADYLINSERAELLFINTTLFKDFVFKFGKYNRTISALNVSYILTRDFSDGKIFAVVSGDQYFHNEYRYSGQRFTVNTCKVWKLNMFHVIEQFSSAGWVIDACDIKKGPYKMTNLILDAKYYPKHVPMGKWRINVKARHEDAGELFSLKWYLELAPARQG